MRKTLLLILFAAAFYGLSYQYLPATGKTTDVFTGDSPRPAQRVVTTAAFTGGNTTLTKATFNGAIHSLYDSIGLASYGLNYDVFRLGMIGYYGLESEGALDTRDLITIIDFEKPSTEKRFYTIDLRNKKVLFHTYVAHGRNTGENMATSFSNIQHSNQSSLGFFVTGETYYGSKGFSLRLDGMEKSFNDQVRNRAVVIHAADYATEAWIKRYGRLGRSQGCPALPPAVSKSVINTIKNGSAIFTYYPDDNYLGASQYLKLENLLQQLNEKPVDLAWSATSRS